jgi:hypothetical protein
VAHVVQVPVLEERGGRDEQVRRDRNGADQREPVAVEARRSRAAMPLGWCWCWCSSNRSVSGNPRRRSHAAISQISEIR